MNISGLSIEIPFCITFLNDIPGIVTGILNPNHRRPIGIASIGHISPRKYQEFLNKYYVYFFHSNLIFSYSFFFFVYIPSFSFYKN